MDHQPAGARPTRGVQNCGSRARHAGPGIPSPACRHPVPQFGTLRAITRPDVGHPGEDGRVTDVLERFGPATQDWFRSAFAAPTTAQAGAWEAISAGKHALVVAPTGSGKTLSAFLWAIDRVFHEKDAAPAPAAKGRRSAGPEARHPHPLHLAPQGARRRRRAQPALPARRHRAVRTPARHRASRRDGRRPLGRHDLERSSQARERPARHPHHDARVAVPHAHEPGSRDAARRAHRHRRRGARRRGDQARRASGGEPRAPRRSASRAPARRCGRAAHRAVGHGAADRRGRAVPRRLGARRDRGAPRDEGVRPQGRRPGRGHAEPAARPGRRGGARTGRVRRGRGLVRQPHPAVDRDDGIGVAARRRGDRRSHPPAPLDDRVRQFAPARRASDGPAQRDLRRAPRPRHPRPDGAGRDDGPGRRDGGGRARAREGAPRLGLEGAARTGRGGAQVRGPALRRGDLEPGARHRHGRGRSRHPGRGAARAPPRACSASAARGTRWAR